MSGRQICQGGRFPAVVLLARRMRPKLSGETIS
jgi:hypothetical protein